MAVNNEELEKEIKEETNEAEKTEKAEGAAESAAEPEEKKEVKVKTEREAQLEKELAEQKEKYLRLMAEYYRKRTAKQQLETREAAVGDTVLKVLAIYDNFERAVATESQDEKYKAGVEMIFKQFTAALEKMNVTVIDPTGEPFDPAVANAVSQIEDPELGENVVAQVFEKGVKIGDRLIRYPTVVVANP